MNVLYEIACDDTAKPVNGTPDCDSSSCGYLFLAGENEVVIGDSDTQLSVERSPGQAAEWLGAVAAAAAGTSETVPDGPLVPGDDFALNAEGTVLTIPHTNYQQLVAYVGAGGFSTFRGKEVAGPGVEVVPTGVSAPAAR